jgi:two-component system, NtrC family, response regulator AtoC
VRHWTEIIGEDLEEISEGLLFVAASPLMRKLRAQAELLAKVNVPVLILGERGSGKDLTARVIHKLSAHSARRFLKLNCASLAPGVLEREILGRERSAGGTAAPAGTGHFDLSDKGTILLDEVAEMPAELQAKLLQVVEQRQFCRIVSETTVQPSARILAATTVNTENRICGKELRTDLYSCLGTFTIQVPPLRQRKEEIPLLIDYFMRRMTRNCELPTRKFSPWALEACERYSWPGNVRELQSFIVRYFVIGDEALAFNEPAPMPASALAEVFSRGSNALTTLFQAMQVSDSMDSSNPQSVLRDVRGQAEKAAIASALEKTHWNRKAAAKLLLISYRALLYKIRQYHMSPPEYLSTIASPGTQ